MSELVWTPSCPTLVTFVTTSQSALCRAKTGPDTLAGSWLFFPSWPHLVSTARVYLHFKLDKIIYTPGGIAPDSVIHDRQGLWVVRPAENGDTISRFSGSRGKCPVTWWEGIFTGGSQVPRVLTDSLQWNIRMNHLISTCISLGVSVHFTPHENL